MPPIFWKGKLTKSMMLLVNLSNAIAWISGNAKNTTAMKERVKQGYNGACAFIGSKIACFNHAHGS
jgi:hypothetical protein